MSIYCFWTDDNPMSQTRIDSLKQLENISGCKVILVTKQNLDNYILKEHPLHPAYKYLSAVHRADYLRTYFMNFYGGGYSDIKKTRGSWIQAFRDLENSDKWICGYPEFQGGVAYPPYRDHWKEMIGNGAYICKPNTPLTKEWYESMINLLDSKLEELEKNPAKCPRDHKETGSDYPMGWNEMLGRIFHRVSYNYKDYVLQTLPYCIFYDYE